MYFTGADGSNQTNNNEGSGTRMQTHANTNTHAVYSNFPHQQQQQYQSPSFTALLNMDLTNHAHHNIIIQHHQLHQQNLHAASPPSYPSPSSFPPPPPFFVPSSSNPPLFSFDLSTRMQQQNTNFERLIENEISNECDVMRTNLTERLKEHFDRLLGAAIRASDNKLVERDLEIEFLRNRSAELERNLARANAEAQVLKEKMKDLKSINAALCAESETNNVTGKGPLCSEEDTESSFVDPHRIAPVHLVCRVCKREPATIMMWPCKHISACWQCDVVTMSCPVCNTIKQNSTEVFFCPSE